MKLSITAGNVTLNFPHATSARTFALLTTVFNDSSVSITRIYRVLCKFQLIVIFKFIIFRLRAFRYRSHGLVVKVEIIGIPLACECWKYLNPLLPELRKKYLKNFFHVILFRMGRKIYMIFLKIFNLKKKLLYEGHGRLARWIKWRTCDVREAKEGLGNELWRRWSNRRVGEWVVM